MATDAAFVDWATSSRAWMRRTAYLLCLDWHQADDLVQDALLKLYRKFPGVEATARDAYARKVLTTVFLDSRRRPWRREIALEDVPELPGRATPWGSGQEADPHDLLIRALATVPPRQRAVLVLRFFQDMSVDQTALALGCTTGTVKSQCARGLDHLRSTLEAWEQV